MHFAAPAFHPPYPLSVPCTTAQQTLTRVCALSLPLLRCPRLLVPTHLLRFGLPFPLLFWGALCLSRSHSVPCLAGWPIATSTLPAVQRPGSCLGTSPAALVLPFLRSSSKAVACHSNELSQIAYPFHAAKPQPAFEPAHIVWRSHSTHHLNHGRLPTWPQHPLPLPPLQPTPVLFLSRCGPQGPVQHSARILHPF